MSKSSNERIEISPASPAERRFQPVQGDAGRGTSAQIARFIEAYRNHGHRVARLDPLSQVALPDLPELTPAFHGLDPAQAQAFQDTEFFSAFSVEQLERQLKRLYCGSIGLDCSGVRSESRRSWLFAQMESASLERPATTEQRLDILRRLLAAEMWERHVAERCEHAKRFSLEGCESLILVLDALIGHAGKHGLSRMFLGMPHRGRLNMLINVMEVSVESILAHLDGDSDLAASQRDLPYHLGGIARKRTEQGELTVCLACNPSHLQSVFPVVSGMARAYNDEHPANPSMAVMVHGDAAFAGQGVVMETLNLTQKSGYALGGTIHVILNNQVGFTTPNAMDVHANLYCTDVGRAIDAPVIRINADDPDAVLAAVRIAVDYRMEHGADVILDLIGYRRLGHSEHDVPALTQPSSQAVIRHHATVTELYHASIETPITLDDLRDAALARFKQAAPPALPPHDDNGPTPQVCLEPVTVERLQALTATLTHPAAGIQLHEVIQKMIANWQIAVSNAEHTVDWRFAENMAYATLLQNGHSIRISGMDVGRGTFMHRHAVWHAQDSLPGVSRIHDAYVPLKHVGPRQGSFDIVNSPLTEEAVLGFEYGYSVQTGSHLTIWEAQYGDFVNGAQVMVDQYIAAGEYKWGYRSALTVLLPHGHEGVGPEHSNAFLGRFLQLCADRNLRVAVPSTSAQWFHLLRRQAADTTLKPLIVMSPKSLLYGNPASHSPLWELTDLEFRPVLQDPAITQPKAVTRVVLCSGKFFYELDAARQIQPCEATALVRVEQLYPFPATELTAILAQFGRLTEVVWAQEEDRNHGAWRFVRDELEAILPSTCRLGHVARAGTPSGACASLKAHRQEQRRLLAEALGWRVSG